MRTFFHMGDVNQEVIHQHIVLFDTFFSRDDFHIPNFTVETLVIMNVVYVSWATTRSVCDQVCVSLLESGVADVDIIGYGEFQDSLTFHVVGTEAMSTKVSRSRNRAFGAHNWNNPKSTPNEHVKQEWCETKWFFFLRKWLKTSIVICFGAQNDLEIGPLRPIFYISLQVAQIDI